MPALDQIERVEFAYASCPAGSSNEFALGARQSSATRYSPRVELNDRWATTTDNVFDGPTEERGLVGFLQSANRFECDYELGNDPALIPGFIAELQEQMIRLQFCDEKGTARLGTALEEALLNGLYHGNLELSSDLREDGSNTFQALAQERRRLQPYCERRLRVQVRISSREAMFVICDEGQGFDVAALPDPTDPENLGKASGRGLLLIRAFMDEVYHNSTGTQITMIKRSD
jgi:hypothetical protein